ncbi:MAG: tetratricopeptide repeat protein [Thermoanaerobaculia bacterium]
MTREQAEGTDRNAIDAVRAAAEAGDAAAQLDLGNRYFYGNGVERDPAAAYSWMRRAAEAGLAEAKSKVGYFLTYGVGVAADPKAAIPWFLAALRGGYAKAGYNLGEAYRKGRKVTFSPRRAWFFYSKAVELGQEAANFGLAALCYEGLGVPRDTRKALELLRRGLRGGDPEAVVEMGRFFREGVADPEDLAEAEARALAFHRPGNLDSLKPLFLLRREACALPTPPPGLDAVNAELNRRQAIGKEHEPPKLDEAGLAALRAKADAGDAEAGYRLGRVLLLRESSATVEALARLLRSADAGHTAAAFQAGTLLYHGWGVPQDVPRALALLESSANAGNADAARFLALAYDGFGGHVPKDPEIAMRWWNEGARLGDRHAAWFVGQLLLEEDATPEGRARGMELIEHAAEHGFPQACGYLGYLRARDFGPCDDLLEEFAFPLLRLGAIRGDYNAARYLAKSLRRLGGRERLGEAVYWLHEASRRDAAAARMLGEFHARGVGVPRSDATAAAWLAFAAEEGDLEAAEMLARGFLDGIGVPRDPLLAIRLAERAAGAGYGRGARLLGRIFEDGLGVRRDDARAAAWYGRGAELGEKISMYCLALMLFDGRGVEPDPARAVSWLEKATEEGDADGRHLLALMLFRGEGTEPDPARARGLFLGAASDGHLPSRFTTLEEEAVRFRPAATRPRDFVRRIAELAADRDSLPATSGLDAGILVWNGDVGLIHDDALAAELFRAAATKGSALAAACLSHVLEAAGEDEEAMEWLEAAARAGLAGAQRHLAFRLVETGRATREDDRVVRLLESAAEQGDALACAEFARLLEAGDLPADARRAERVGALRRCAVEGGYPQEAMGRD